MTVLVVDDDPVMQLVTAHVLTEGGNIVHVAANGAEAIEIAGRETVELVLLDLMLDQEDGLDVAARLRTNNSNTFDIIVLSGRTDAENDDRLANVQVAGVIPKPFDPQTLCAQIHNILSAP